MNPYLLITNHNGLANHTSLWFPSSTFLRRSLRPVHSEGFLPWPKSVSIFRSLALSSMADHKLLWLSLTCLPCYQENGVHQLVCTIMTSHSATTTKQMQPPEFAFWLHFCLVASSCWLKNNSKLVINVGSVPFYEHDCMHASPPIYGNIWWLCEKVNLGPHTNRRKCCVVGCLFNPVAVTPSTR